MKDTNGKSCTKCSEYKCWDQFQKDKNTKDGYTSLCRECRNKNSAKWRKENPGKAKAAVKAWVIENYAYVLSEARRYALIKREALGKEGWRDAVAAWNAENPERLASQRKAHYAKNKDRLHLKQKLDRSARPESYRAYDAAKRAKRRNGHCPWANKEAVQAIYDLAQELTRVTGISHHVDHVIPLVNKSVQGLHVEHNLRIVTAEENLIKGNRVIDGL